MQILGLQLDNYVLKVDLGSLFWFCTLLVTAETEG